MSQKATLDPTRIYEKTAGRCAYCHRALNVASRCTPDLETGAWDVDDWIPREQAHRFPGFDIESEDNLVPACCVCRAAKGTQTGEEYRARLSRTGQVPYPSNPPTIQVIERLLRSSPSFLSLRPGEPRSDSQAPDNETK